MSNSISQLFTEKFRPQELASLIAPKRIKDQLSKGLIQNLLLYGSPGTGKCVDENTIITVRNKKTGNITDISFRDFLIFMERQELEK